MLAVPLTTLVNWSRFRRIPSVPAGRLLVTGLLFALTWPALLSLPLGLYQIYLITQIARGARPRWSVLALTASATLGLTLYLLNLAMWTN